MSNLERLFEQVRMQGPTSPTLQDALDVMKRGVIDGAARHLEMFAAAYYLATDIPPQDAVLVQQIGTDGMVRWWFEHKPQGVPRVSDE